jgi:hypothetical protein
MSVNDEELLKDIDYSQFLEFLVQRISERGESIYFLVEEFKKYQYKELLDRQTNCTHSLFIDPMFYGGYSVVCSYCNLDYQCSTCYEMVKKMTKIDREQLQKRHMDIYCKDCRRPVKTYVVSTNNQDLY